MPVFAAATFLGAFLLFLVQPMIARYILPWFGGGPAVWTTCMLFFQTVLLAGYAYAHLGITLTVKGRLSPRAHAFVHIALLIASLALLPFLVPSPDRKPVGADDPTWRILLLLATTVGLPYFVLSATGPLLQAWFSRLDPGRDATRTYRLYALSNVGSLLALVSYPFVVEPMLGRTGQAWAWAAGLIAFAPACAACGLLVARRRPVVAMSSDGPADGGVSDGPVAVVSERKKAADARRAKRRRVAAGETSPAPLTTATSAPPTAARRLLWLALPICASVLLLAVTNELTQNVAPIPLLWVLPLALYLLSFVIAFAGGHWYHRAVFGPLLVAAAILVYTMLARRPPAPPPTVAGQTAGFAFVLFVFCTVCHGELARLRPPPRWLTGYYLTISAGGAIGGLFVALVAPMLFTKYTELQIGLVAAVLVAVLAVCASAGRPVPTLAVVGAVGGVVLFGIGLWIASDRSQPFTTVVSQSRDFYGVLTVERAEPPGRPEEAFLRLNHGTIRHGLQLEHRDWRGVPTGYYAGDGGAGLAFRGTRPAPGAPGRRVGVVGLGVGTLAAYGRPGDMFRFYELHPKMAELAAAPFTYLRDSAARCEVVLGDARLSLEREPPQAFDLLVLDAFTGDAIPIHLLTAEAFDVYRRHIAPGGVLAAHISNIYVDLQPVLKRAADHAGWESAILTVIPGPGRPDLAEEANWVLMAVPGRLDPFRAVGAKPLTDKPDIKLWTDDRTDLVRALR